MSDLASLDNVIKKLELLNTLKDYKVIYDELKNVTNAYHFFERVSGKKPWSIQKTWIKRVLKGLSFSIVAPTGVGKTFFGSVMCLYLAKNNKRCYIVLPTTPLVDQVFNRIQPMIENNDDLKAIRVVAYHSNLTKTEKEERVERIKNGDFDILITTTQYLAKNFEYLKAYTFDFIFVDDVDAILKASKNIFRVLSLIGFNDKTIDMAVDLIKAKTRYHKLLISKKGQKDYEVSSVANMIKSLSQSIIQWKRRKKVGQLVVSSATSKPRGKKVLLFRELLGFQIGSIGEGVRKIYDYYLEVDENKYDEELIKLTKGLLGDGGIIFVPKDKGIEEAERVANVLRSIGFSAEAYHAQKKGDILTRFRQKEIDILVGVAIHQGLLVRGIDMPERVKYVIFLDVPHHTISLKTEKIPPISLLFVVKILAEATENKEIKDMLKRMRALLKSLEPASIKLLKDAVLNDKPLQGYLEKVRTQILDISRKCFSLLSQPLIQRQLRMYPYARILHEADGFTIIIPDVDTYIQASGRTSRLYPGGVTTGLSIILTPHINLVSGLRKQLSWRYEQAVIKEYHETEITDLIEKINSERKIVAGILEGKYEGTFVDPVKSALLIVESPNKAKTIANFFGKPTIRPLENIKVYEVSTGDFLLNIVATKGHMFDLVNKTGIHGVERINGRFTPVYGTIKRCSSCGAQFVDGTKCPKCGSTEIKDAKSIVNEIINLAKEVDITFLGLDPDIEGEKIAWDVFNIIAIAYPEVKRMEFHEVSKTAIHNGLHTPRNLDINLVKAQLVRRIEDRWLGYELSRVLWDKFNKTNLSAGRVQSTVLKWIITRYNDWQRTLHYFYKLNLGQISILLDFPEDKTLSDAAKREKELKSTQATVVSVEQNIRTINPLPPYSTDTMLADATRVLKLSADTIMKLAQDLFESGLITYHRTDSTRISTQGFKIAKDYITDTYGSSLYFPRQFGHGGAHECIRPVRPINAKQLVELMREGVISNTKLTPNHLSLYSLIFRRFMASQMTVAEGKYQVAKLQILDKEIRIEGLLELTKEGFTVEYNLHLPLKVKPLNPSQTFSVVKVKKWRSSQTRLYTQAELIKEMKEKGIGRPSTYAVIIQKLFARGYIEEKNGKIRPTLLGTRVGNFLSTHYYDLVSEEKTRNLYEKMNRVETNEADYQEILNDTFNELKEKIPKAFQ